MHRTRPVCSAACFKSITSNAARDSTPLLVYSTSNCYSPDKCYAPEYSRSISRRYEERRSGLVLEVDFSNWLEIKYFSIRVLVVAYQYSRSIGPTVRTKLVYSRSICVRDGVQYTFSVLEVDLHEGSITHVPRHARPRAEYFAVLEVYLRTGLESMMTYRYSRSISRG
ncbi:hypothetical protein EXIGLDRAFT_752503, partial [Exidia glandulosa HHB12029]